ncbi:MAG: hypothetical protein FP813_04980 [Desulfurivibrio sp.]|nr:hypothetical protein [Desulfurivibrio sp.]MBU3937038.1 hypothetical protein [Pseudomonadota bacterium]MBU4033633.1 hypothetical protein [Pseudomonadota bacterium]MBU4119164.1 hypothetical protein [Pseudomonadota bacterium]
MRTLNLRPIAFAVLLLTFLSVSGATFADVALASPGTADSCCFPSGQSEESPQPPCATPECSCLFCLNLHLPLFTDISSPSLFATSLAFHHYPHPLAAFVHPIDYPPERS